MHPSISRDDPQIHRHEAEIATRRLVRRLRLPRADLDDIRPDLLVDLICRLPALSSRLARLRLEPAMRGLGGRWDGSQAA